MGWHYRVPAFGPGFPLAASRTYEWLYTIGLRTSVSYGMHCSLALGTSAVEIISVVVALPPVCSGIHLRASDESTTLYLVGLIAFVGMACL